MIVEFCGRLHTCRLPCRIQRRNKGQNQTESPTQGFVVQVGSFQKFRRADDLKNKLINSDYSVFIASILEEEIGQTMHRVYVGTFLKKIDAEKAAVEIDSLTLNNILQSY